MAYTSLNGKYFIKKNAEDSWTDVTTMFDGVKILSISGMNAIGDAVNVFTQQWITSQTEDFMVTLQDENQNDVIIRANVDIEMTFIVGARYSSSPPPIGSDNTQAVYDTFVEYITKHGDFYVKSEYTGKEAHVVCLKGFSPTTEKLQRQGGSYILATATLHVLDAME